MVLTGGKDTNLFHSKEASIKKKTDGVDDAFTVGWVSLTGNDNLLNLRSDHFNGKIDRYIQGHRY